MRRVFQNGEEECGTACVAMLAGVTLEQARERFPDQCRTAGATSEQLRTAALTFGIETEARRTLPGKDFKQLDFDAVLLGTLGGDPHWSVWDVKRLKRLDPYQDAEKWEWICNSYVKVIRRPGA